MTQNIAFAVLLGIVLNATPGIVSLAHAASVPAQVDPLPQYETIQSDPKNTSAVSADPLPEFETVYPTPTPRPKTDLAVTVAIALPQPLTFGIQGHREDSKNIDIFFEGGFFKYPITSSDRSFSDYSFQAGVRYHPFRNWFYVTGELGFRELGVSVDISNLKQGGVALANTATLSDGTFFFGALIGGEWKMSTHLSLAFDLGIQIALLHTGSVEIHGDPSQDSGADLSVDDSEVLSRISGLPLPQIAILRVLWYL
jgi:hypothetical protein